MFHSSARLQASTITLRAERRRTNMMQLLFQYKTGYCKPLAPHASLRLTTLLPL